MTQEEHSAASNRLMVSSRLLRADGDTMGSAEMVWGAAMQAMHALIHRNRDWHTHSIKNLEIVIGLAAPSLLIQQRLSLGLVAATNLHNHFYTNGLSGGEITAAMASGQDFVNEVLQLAQSPSAT